MKLSHTVPIECTDGREAHQPQLQTIQHSTKCQLIFSAPGHPRCPVINRSVKKKKHHRSYAMCDKSLRTQKSKEPGENTGGEEVRERWNDGNYANHCNEPLRHFPHKFQGRGLICCPLFKIKLPFFGV